MSSITDAYFTGPHVNVLITGGSQGIGRGLAERLHASGAKILITGRNQEELQKMKARLPGLSVFVGDIGDATSREQLAEYVKSDFKKLNVVINNAGIQRRVSLAADTAPWSEKAKEIDILLGGPIHLNSLLIPLLLRNDGRSLIVNVSSGGAFVPQPFAPIYSACKAAIHSYTMTLRDSLSNTNCHVIELIPPAVATGLAGPGDNHGANLDDFCNEVFPQIVAANTNEIGFGVTASDQFKTAAGAFQSLFEAGTKRATIQRY